jgi:nucleoside-diphosphate-sugar epimerase
VDESPSIGVLGAKSLVGECAIPLLIRTGRHVFACSRQPPDRKQDDGVTWLQVPWSSPECSDAPRITTWLSVAPIWVLPGYFPLFEGSAASRVVALSSTSVFVKADSPDRGEQVIARRLAEGESALQTWAEAHHVEWVILRPTLIYGCGRDKNIVEIARFVRQYGFFPLLGRAMGLRQPVHAADVAAACVSAMNSPAAGNRTYNLSGGETLPYQEMLCRVSAAVGKSPCLVPIPRWLFRLAVTALRLLPRYRNWTVEMAERMNRDLVFDHADAERDLGFSPRPFRLSPEDLPA